MFSGIIERLARVTLATPQGGSLKIEVESGFPDLSLGESIAVNGVCLTVTLFDETGRAAFFISPGKAEALEHQGIAVVERVPLEIPANPHNWRYLAIKRDKFGTPSPTGATEPRCMKPCPALPISSVSSISKSRMACATGRWPISPRTT